MAGKKIVLTLLLLTVVTTFEACDPSNLFKCVNRYSPLLPFTITPTRDTIKVGDTLWIEANFSDTVVDWESKQKMKYENFDFRLFLTIFELNDTTTTNQGQPIATNKFSIGSKYGTIAKRSKFCPIELKYADKKYGLKGYVIPNDSGLYLAHLGSEFLADLVTKSQNISGANPKCLNYIRDVATQINNGNTHKYLADNKGIKFVHSNPPDPLREWSYSNMAYYFFVEP